LIHTNLFHTVPSYLSKIHFTRNIVHPPTPWSFPWSLSFWLSHQYPICILLLPLYFTLNGMKLRQGILIFKTRHRWKGPRNAVKDLLQAPALLLCTRIHISAQRPALLTEILRTFPQAFPTNVVTVL
jgi:hypothetical protein